MIVRDDDKTIEMLAMENKRLRDRISELNNTISNNKYTIMELQKQLEDKPGINDKIDSLTRRVKVLENELRKKNAYINKLENKIPKNKLIQLRVVIDGNILVTINKKYVVKSSTTIFMEDIPLQLEFHSMDHRYNEKEIDYEYRHKYLHVFFKCQRHIKRANG